MGEWIKKMWRKYIYTHTLMNYYSDLRKKEILSYAKKWMNLENIMLGKISESQKEIYCMIPLT